MTPRRERMNRELLEHVANEALKQRRKMAEGIEELISMGRISRGASVERLLQLLRKAKSPEDIIHEAEVATREKEERENQCQQDKPLS